MDYFDTGFCVHTPSWHGKEVLLEDFPTDWNDARTKAGLLWEPRAEPYYRLADPANGIFEAIPGRQIITRDDSGAFLGETSDGFELFSNESMGGLLETFLGGRQNLKFDTAGSCRGGQQVWAVCRLDEPFVIPGDDSPTFPLAVLLNSHDGKGAVRASYTTVRVVCANTFAMADAEAEGRNGSAHQQVFRHTSGLNERVELAKKALAEMEHDSNEWLELATSLFELKMADTELALARFQHDFPGLASPREHGKPSSDQVEANVEKSRAAFRHIYLHSATITDAQRPTALGLVQAAGEYLDHVRGFRNQDTYLGRQILRPEPLKALAIRQARKVQASF